MADEPQSKRGSVQSRRRSAPAADDCLMVIFGAGGDLTKRLLVPALYNLAIDKLLPERFAVIGTALDDLTTESFRERLTGALAQFTTRKSIQKHVLAELLARFHYVPGRFEDPALYGRLDDLITSLDAEHGTGGNVLFYLATPPVVFGMVGEGLAAAGLHQSERGWRRLVVEKPFGHDLESARALNRTLFASWREEQIFRIDHYLGKGTVQNLLAFRFSSGLFEALWSKSQIDHIQFAVSESVGVEGRGAYYEHAGVLRDMVQNRSKLYDGPVYGRLIEPLLAGVHGFVAEHLPPGPRVLDACCGTGGLARRIAQAGREVVGVDLSPRNIEYASARGALDGLSFTIADVSELAVPTEGPYDVATIVLALHEMPTTARLPVLQALMRVARRVFVVDYAVPMAWNVAGARNRALELAAGPEHFLAFRDFYRRGGLSPLIESSGAGIESQRRIDAGTLHVAVVSGEA